jgi:hypothetical protein
MRPANLEHDATRFIIASSDSSREILPERVIGLQSTDNCTISSTDSKRKSERPATKEKTYGFLQQRFFNQSTSISTRNRST